MALSTQQSTGQSGPETRRAERRSSGGPRADVTAGRSAGDPARPVRAAGGHVTGRRQLTERGGRRRLRRDARSADSGPGDSATTPAVTELTSTNVLLMLLS